MNRAVVWAATGWSGTRALDGAGSSEGRDNVDGTKGRDNVGVSEDADGRGSSEDADGVGQQCWPAQAGWRWRPKRWGMHPGRGTTLERKTKDNRIGVYV